VERLLCGCIVQDPTLRQRGVPASYDWTGVRYEWRTASDGPRRLALDVERLDTPRPDCLVPRGWTTDSFLAAWTRAEVIAKLLGVPVLVRVKRHPLGTADLGRWYEEGEDSDRRCRVYTDVDRSAAVVFSCGWVVQDWMDDPSPKARVRGDVVREAVPSGGFWSRRIGR
jgi:hypothetical protein